MYPFILTLIAGLSTLLGTILIFITKKQKNIIISSLAFAGGVMTTISITDLIPEAIKLLNTHFRLFPTILISSIFIVVGIIFSMLIDKYLPDNKVSKDGLYRVGIISMLAIILHNIPEGIATFLSSSINIKLGFYLTLAIALHNIPEGISISIPIYYSTGSRKKAFLYTLISGLSEPFGAFLAYFFLSPFINNTIMGLILSIIAGIMIHISIYELIPTSLSYKNKKLTVLFFIIGSLFMIGNHFLLN